jgi:hypothetical protein
MLTSNDDELAYATGTSVISDYQLSERIEKLTTNIFN